MPELPEVETVVRDLRPAVVGRVIARVRRGRHSLRRPWLPTWSRMITGRRIETIGRRGKWILLTLTGGRTLVIHLGMTGQLTVADPGSPVPSHTHLTFVLDGPGELRFRDVRRFGSADLFPSLESLNDFLSVRLGPEPFDLTAEQMQSAVRTSVRSLKALLLDQSVVAGVGNIYADEACHLAGLNPGRRGQTLTDADCDRLRSAVVAVLNRAISARGSTIRDFVGGSGLMGTYQGEFRVYGRTGEPCPTCRSPIERARHGGRSSHYCPRCQPRRPPAGK